MPTIGRKTTVAAILLTALSSPAARAREQQRAGEAAQIQEGLFDKTVQRRVTMRYLLSLPPGYGREKTVWPLIFYLHGGLGRGSDFERLAWYPLPRLLRERGGDLPFVVLMPQCPADDNWGDPEALFALLEDVIASHAIDADRVYLAGYSMGGSGAWRLAYAHPETFAAVAPMSGLANPAWAPRLRTIPFWVFHGARDDRIPPRESEQMVAALRAEGADVRLSLDPERGHSPPSDEDHMRLFEWFLTHRRAAAPGNGSPRP
jgi:predicted peptidase